MLTCGLALATTVTAGTAAAGPRAAATPAELGISFNYDGHDKQCVSPGQQWAPSPDWTNALLIDTDSRRGGCLLAFGVRDLASNLTGLALTYRWEVSPGGHSGQCGDQGLYPLPITSTHTFGSAIRADTDDRGGYCNLTFAMSGRTDVALDIRFWAEVEDGKQQCVNSLPQSEWHSVRPDAPITIGLNTDSRIGGCKLSLRLRQF